MRVFSTTQETTRLLPKAACKGAEEGSEVRHIGSSVYVYDFAKLGSYRK